MDEHNPTLLLILDGWGYSQSSVGNAIHIANTPTFDRLWEQSSRTLLEASAECVGLPSGQMGNSEVGHMTIGSGRPIVQDLSRINKSIQDQTFATHLLKPIQQARDTKRRVHVIGLLSDGGVHSSLEHIIELVRVLNEESIPYAIHGFLDGRDTHYKSALSYTEALEKWVQKPLGQISTVAGRFYAMDRDERYDRTEQAYLNLTERNTQIFSSVQEGIQQFYDKGVSDEFIHPFQIEGAHLISDRDCVISMNFRADRIKQLSFAITDGGFEGFSKKVDLRQISFYTLTPYDENLQAEVLFPREEVHNTLGEVLELQNIKQLRLAETEKYAHVTYFMNGGQDRQFNNEFRKLIPSPKVATYDLKPQMSLIELTDILIESLLEKQYPFIVCNFANADMVGHTGNLNATIHAVEAIDNALKNVMQAIDKASGHLFLTSDHGNAEKMLSDTQSGPHTAHTHNPVPFIYYGSLELSMRAKGTLADIAPTLLCHLNIEKPKEMSGRSLKKHE